MCEPDDAPAVCPVCETAYGPVSVHDQGLIVNLLDNERYRRVCFEPVAGENGDPLVRFYHHTHEQAGTDAGPDARSAAPVTDPGADEERHG
jgi:hypothetical protein